MPLARLFATNMVRVASRNGITADRWLRHLERHVPVARAGVDPEGVHQMRVAIARLRVWLALGGWRVLDDDLRWLRDRIARIRDLDVQLGHRPPPSWAATLRRRHDRARHELLGTLGHPRVSSMLAGLSCLPPVPILRARRRIPPMARRVLARARAARRRGYDLPSLHRLRCIVRRLRFALEWIGAETADLVRVQDALGEACDLSIAVQTLGKRRGERVRRYRAKLVRDLRRARREARGAFLEARPDLEDLACSSS
jgi:CHAD domain-containing protein